MFGGAGVFGVYAFGALTAAIILALSLAMTGWLAALIVAVLYGAIAGVLALQGKSKVKAGTPPMPEQTVQSVKADVAHQPNSTSRRVGNDRRRNRKTAPTRPQARRSRPNRFGPTSNRPARNSVTPSRRWPRRPTSRPRPRAASRRSRTPLRPSATSTSHKAKQATPESASAGADQLASTVQDKPLPFAVGAAFVIGLAIGWLLGRR